MSSLERKAAKMLAVGFTGTTPPNELRELIGRGVASAILFKRNIEAPEQVAALTTDIKRIARHPVLLCVDQEGGRVARLRDGFTTIPSMRALGKTNDVRLAYDVGRVLARELRAVNIDLDFTPVVDVDTNPNNPVIADRSFGADVDLVSRMGVALIKGLQENGAAACAKHFPGHGDTSQDSHYDLPRLPHSVDRLRRVELPPFKAAVDADVAMIMTSHVIFEPLDGKYPATMSRSALDGILRDQMHYDGVVISDDLEMKAIADHFALEDVIIRGVDAGCDLFAVCHSAELQNEFIDILVRAVERGDVSRDRIEEANRRVDRLLNTFAGPAVDPDMLGALDSPEHRAVIERIRAVEQRVPDPTDMAAHRRRR
jgi:beta-N-acetylhexosaminidase